MRESQWYPGVRIFHGDSLRAISRRSAGILQGTPSCRPGGALGAPAARRECFARGALALCRGTPAGLARVSRGAPSHCAAAHSRAWREHFVRGALALCRHAAGIDASFSRGLESGAPEFICGALRPAESVRQNSHRAVPHCRKLFDGELRGAHSRILIYSCG